MCVLTERALPLHSHVRSSVDVLSAVIMERFLGSSCSECARPAVTLRPARECRGRGNKSKKKKTTGRGGVVVRKSQLLNHAGGKKKRKPC